MQCGSPNEETQDLFVYDADVQDDGVYAFDCRNGHHNVVIVQENKFEILFEIGLNAIADGYYREAVSSVTSSLERFYEFYMRAAALKNTIPKDQFENAWKAIRNQSERQLGGFILAYLIQTGKSPTLLDNKLVTFRNEVIHKGHIPSREKAIEYANAVLNLVNPILLHMKQTLEPEMHSLVLDRMRELNKKLDGTSQRTVMRIGSTISVSTAASVPYPTTIEDRLSKLEKQKFRG